MVNNGAGRAHTLWSADEALTYRAMHKRLDRIRGLARQHQCVDCTAQAAQWSYNYGDPNEMRTDDGWPYSPNMSSYSPRCIDCHHRHDHPEPSRCPQGHEYTPENTRWRKGKHRLCIECKRAVDAARYQEAKTAAGGKTPW